MNTTSNNNSLVSTLAESLVDELSNSKSLNLMNDEKFSEFTDLLHEILDKQDEKANDKDKEDKGKKPEGEKEESQNKVLEEKLEQQRQDIQDLVDIITDYFDIKDDKKKDKTKTKAKKESKRDKDFNDRTKKILTIVQNLSDDKKKEKEKAKELINKAKDKKPNVKTYKEAVKINKMLTKLTKDFKKADKKKDVSIKELKRGLASVKRKISSVIAKTFNKFKSWLVIGLLALFAKPIWNALKGVLTPLWENVLKPKFTAWFQKLGGLLQEGFEVAKDWFKKAFPGVANWIEKEWPKVSNWFAENWTKISDWVTNILPTIQNTYEKIKNIVDKVMPLLETYLAMKSPVKFAMGKFAVNSFFNNDDEKDTLKRREKELNKQLKKAQAGTLEHAEIQAELAQVSYDYKKLNGDFEGNQEAENKAIQAINTAQKQVEDIQYSQQKLQEAASQRAAQQSQSGATTTKPTYTPFGWANFDLGSNTGQEQKDMTGGESKIAADIKSSTTIFNFFGQPSSRRK